MVKFGPVISEKEKNIKSLKTDEQTNRRKDEKHQVIGKTYLNLQPR